MCDGVTKIENCLEISFTDVEVCQILVTTNKDSPPGPDGIDFSNKISLLVLGIYNYHELKFSEWWSDELEAVINNTSLQKEQ